MCQLYSEQGVKKRRKVERVWTCNNKEQKKEMRSHSTLSQEVRSSFNSHQARQLARTSELCEEGNNNSVYCIACIASVSVYSCAFACAGACYVCVFVCALVYV